MAECASMTALAWSLRSLDIAVISFLNGFAHRSWAFDALVAMISTNALIKGGLVTALIWWAWFRPGPKQAEHRELLVAGMAAAFVGLFVARGLAEALPFRERPMWSAAVHFQPPYFLNEAVVIRWSSFPSDHAALFFALAMCLFFVSRRAGIVSLIYVFVVVCLPRVYMGFHYPTDILAGAALGVGAAYLARISWLRVRLCRPAMRWLEQSPGTFYVGLFLLTFQIAVTFDSLRHIARYLAQLGKILLHMGA